MAKRSSQTEKRPAEPKTPVPKFPPGAMTHENVAMVLDHLRGLPETPEAALKRGLADGVLQLLLGKGHDDEAIIKEIVTKLEVTDNGAAQVLLKQVHSMIRAQSATLKADAAKEGSAKPSESDQTEK